MMEITILDCVLNCNAFLRFFVSTSSRSVHESSSMTMLATVLCLNFLGVDVLHLRSCRIEATMQGRVGWPA
jgi:hypothetical protein